jgi:glycosyltransferase involved in cell wall biosynthesis
MSSSLAKTRLVSIVVATYNAQRTLKQCLDSVLAQSHQPQEIIVVDGKSTDGTLDILRAYDPAELKWTSEKDNGIYDAWNKAISSSKGEWLCFLGADDFWSSPDSLKQLVECGERCDAEMVFSRANRLDSTGGSRGVWGDPWNWSRMKRWQCVLHPGALHKKDLFDRVGLFDAGYRIAGDYEFMLRLGSTLKTGFVDDVTICVGDNGVSRTDVTQALNETRKIQAAHPEIGWARAGFNYGVAQAKAFARGIFCKSC